MSAFFDLYASLPRQGPGDRENLDFALRIVGAGGDANIADAGCGTGADIEGLLAWAPEGHVTAIDTCAQFIEAVDDRYAAEPRVTVICGDMADLGGPFDVIWSAGSLYFLGLEECLTTFHDKLVESGCLVFSHPAFFVAKPSEAARAFWEGEGEIQQADAVLAATRAAGYDILDAYKLPDAAWEAYYAPLKAQIDTLTTSATTDMEAVLNGCRAEIAGWHAVRAETGYLQIVAART